MVFGGVISAFDNHSEHRLDLCRVLLQSGDDHLLNISGHRHLFSREVANKYIIEKKEKNELMTAKE
jgi:hypothetical protein